jgi:hypothetical protein
MPIVKLRCLSYGGSGEGNEWPGLIHFISFVIYFSILQKNKPSSSKAEPSLFSRLFFLVCCWLRSFWRTIDSRCGSAWIIYVVPSKIKEQGLDRDRLKLRWEVHQLRQVNILHRVLSESFDYRRPVYVCCRSLLLTHQILQLHQSAILRHHAVNMTVKALEIFGSDV